MMALQGSCNRAPKSDHDYIARSLKDFEKWSEQIVCFCAIVSTSGVLQWMEQLPEYQLQHRASFGPFANGENFSAYYPHFRLSLFLLPISTFSIIYFPSNFFPPVCFPSSTFSPIYFPSSLFSTISFPSSTFSAIYFLLPFPYFCLSSFFPSFCSSIFPFLYFHPFSSFVSISFPSSIPNLFFLHFSLFSSSFASTSLPPSSTHVLAERKKK